MKKVNIKEFLFVIFLFIIPFSNGAFLYGYLDRENIFHIPILIISVIMFYILLKMYQEFMEKLK